MKSFRTFSSCGTPSLLLLLLTICLSTINSTAAQSLVDQGAGQKQGIYLPDNSDNVNSQDGNIPYVPQLFRSATPVNPSYKSSEPETPGYDDQQTECTTGGPGLIDASSAAQWTEAPFMVSLRDINRDRFTNFGTGHFCGGVLIHPYVVLTAASCIANRLASDVGVVVGTLNRRKEASSTQLLFVQKMIAHPLYTVQTGSHDIAMMLLKTAAYLDTRVKVAPLAFKNPRAGSDCTLYGWGKTAPQGQYYSDCLRRATVKVEDMDQCKQNFMQANMKIPPSVFCARGGADACHGDIGGPAICDGSLYGIITNKVGCEIPSAGRPYTNVYSFRNWIEYTLNILKIEFQNIYPKGFLDIRRDGRDEGSATEVTESSGVAIKCMSIGMALAAGLSTMFV